MTVASDTTGAVTGNCGYPCVETDTLSFALAPSGERLFVTITKTAFVDGTTGRPLPVPSGSAAVGDSSYLEFVAPHLLKETLIRSSVSAIDQKYGNPYWCGEGLAASKQGVCGA